MKHTDEYSARLEPYEVYLEDTRGFFIHRNIHMTPYRHHCHKAFWKVLLTDNSDKSPYINSRVYNIVARNAREASALSYEAWRRDIQDEAKLKELNERNENLRRIRTKGKPALDKLQREKDSGIS
jgi:hypothetical protein